MTLQPDHAATEAKFHAGLWSPETPEGYDSRRFAVYRNNVQHGLSTALAARFPVVERLVGAPFFAAMARVFAGTHPPRTPVLLDWGDQFPAFLAGFPPVASLPYLPDVARLEWLRGCAFHAADVPVADPATLGRVNPDTVTLTLAPSVQAYASRWPALSIWQANQPGARAAALPAGPEYALIARASGLAIVTEPLAAEHHAILCRILSGASLAEAATTDPTPLLALLLRHGLIAEIGETR